MLTLIRAGSHLGPESQVPSPTRVTKSQHGGKVSTSEHQGTIKIRLINIEVGSGLIYAEVFAGLGLRVGSSFLARPHSQHKSQASSSNVLSCRHPCHSWDWGFGVPCEVVSSNFHVLDGWDCTDRPQETWDLGLGTSCELAICKSPIYKEKSEIQSYGMLMT